MPDWVTELCPNKDAFIKDGCVFVSMVSELSDYPSRGGVRAGTISDNPCTVVRDIIYKIFRAAEDAAFLDAGQSDGAPIDLADGYIHFSTREQVEETAAKHFAGKGDLLLASFDPDAFDDALKWEVSRGGALFPHLYATLDPTLAIDVHDLPQLEDGGHQFPQEY